MKRRIRLTARIATLLATGLFWSGCQSPPAPPPVVATKPAPADPAVVAPLPTTPRYQKAAKYSADHAGHALLIIEGNRIVFETGQGGHRADAPHALHTASRAFWSLLVVAGDADGVLDLDEPVAFTLREFEGTRWKKDIRIRHLLQLTSGLEAGWQPLSRGGSTDRHASAIALGSVAPPGEVFQHSPSHYAVLGALLAQKLASGSEDQVAYLQRRLLDPLGITVSAWERDAKGQPDIDAGAHLSAREWAKLGEMIRDGGVFRGKTILNPAGIAEVLSGSRANPGFGLGVWLNPARDPGQPRPFHPSGAAAHEFADLSVLAGTGNQRLYAIPSMGLVVVRFGAPDPTFRDSEFLATIVAAERP